MHVLAIDQGTTGTTAMLFDEHGVIIGKAYREFPQIFPRPGWVEHDPCDIWRTVIETVSELLTAHNADVVAIGITNQRETTVIWDRTTGEPVYNAIVWQCRRTTDRCRTLSDHESYVRERTGLPIDAYFSATKIRWILDHADLPDLSDIAFGTIDTWLIWNLTGGAVHATDYTNASRTLLLNIEQKDWDEELCELFDVPMHILPEVRPSAGGFGEVKTLPDLRGVPILGVAGDQQAALFGQACFSAGRVKNTYGTGSFMVMNTGNSLVRSKRSLVTTLAVDGTGKPCYALEGSMFMAGASIQWLRDELKLLDSAADSERMACSVKDNGGVYLVPAFVGLGAPHWDMDVRGAIVGLTRGAGRNHIVRAALEAMAYQSADVITEMECESGCTINELTVDGGAVANDFLMQFQADIIARPVIRPRIIESTSLGAAMLAGLSAGVWKNADELAGLNTAEFTFEPCMSIGERRILLNGWHHALRQAMTK